MCFLCWWLWRCCRLCRRRRCCCLPPCCSVAVLSRFGFESGFRLVWFNSLELRCISPLGFARSHSMVGAEMNDISIAHTRLLAVVAHPTCDYETSILFCVLLFGEEHKLAIILRGVFFLLLLWLVRLGHIQICVMQCDWLRRRLPCLHAAHK